MQALTKGMSMDTAHCASPTVVQNRGINELMGRIEYTKFCKILY